jgi:ribosome recycling factor
MDQIKKLEKDGKISEDESGKLHTKVQDLTDKTIKEIDALFATKEQEIMQV